VAENTKTIEIDADIFEIARRTAALDNVDVPTLVESLVRRHAEYVETLEEIVPDMPGFSLADYELQRDPGETNEEYKARLNLFR
jgi:hypothetical protein